MYGSKCGRMSAVVEMWEDECGVEVCEDASIRVLLPTITTAFTLTFTVGFRLEIPISLLPLSPHNTTNQIKGIVLANCRIENAAELRPPAARAGLLAARPGQILF